MNGDGIKALGVCRKKYNTKSPCKERGLSLKYSNPIGDVAVTSSDILCI